MAFRHKIPTLAAALGMMAVASSPAMASSVYEADLHVGWGCAGGWNPAVVSAVADLLGVSEAELVEAGRRGLSLADVAQARGVEIDVLVATLLSSRREATERAVAAGKLERHAADAIIDHVADRLGERVTDPLQPTTCTLPPTAPRGRSAALIDLRGRDGGALFDGDPPGAHAAFTSGPDSDLPPAA